MKLNTIVLKDDEMALVHAVLQGRIEDLTRDGAGKNYDEIERLMLLDEFIFNKDKKAPDMQSRKEIAEDQSVEIFATWAFLILLVSLIIWIF